MPRARQTQINLSDTPYYHCVSRCVRRAFLCGTDTLTGQCYEHRRKWVEDRIRFLSTVFSIDVCAYAVMSNHTHLVVHVDSNRVKRMSIKEIIEKWHQLYKGTHLTRQYLAAENNESMDDLSLTTVQETAEVWRKRLCDISWFMRSLNEYIARQANKEDNCTGHFWEGRFKSQALLDETSLLACMAYVDLNPVRANIASSIEDSDYTSIQHRLKAIKAGRRAKFLMPFAKSSLKITITCIPFSLADYIKLVDDTGRQVTPNKRGKIHSSEPSALTKLNLDSAQWLELSTEFEACFQLVAGNVISLETYAAKYGKKRVSGRANAMRLFG